MKVLNELSRDILEFTESLASRMKHLKYDTPGPTNFNSNFGNSL